MTQLPQAIAWTLIHFCWQAAAIAAAYRIISAAIARRSSQTRYLVALSALLLMLGTAVGTFAWEMRSDSTAISIAATAANLRASIAADFPARLRQAWLATAQQAAEPRIDARRTASLDRRPLARRRLALSVRSLGGWWYLRRLRLASTIEAPAAVRAAFRRISKILGPAAAQSRSVSPLQSTAP